MESISTEAMQVASLKVSDIIEPQTFTNYYY